MADEGPMERLAGRYHDKFGELVERETRARTGAEEPATRAATPLQRRIREALEMAEIAEHERRAKGGPDDLGEVDRELTMIEGALEGVRQRVGEVTASVRPVLDEKALAAVLGELEQYQARSDDEWAPRTAVGRRVRGIQTALSEIEAALAYLAQGVRL